MTIADGLIILAVFLGPVVAVRVTRYLDDQREIRERKVQIFKTLMATRSYSVSWAHVEALNKIDLEFNKDVAKEKEVIEMWKEYLDHLNNITGMPIDQWAHRRIELLVELLHKMAHVLDYDFDKTHIKNSSYSPVAHGQAEDDNEALRKRLIEVLQGKKHIPMKIVNAPRQ